MDIDTVAERASESLRAEFGGAILAVGRYSKAADQQARTVYTATFERSHGENTSRSVLEDAPGDHRPGAYETSHDERLTATVRIYETLVDVVVPLAGGKGVVVAVERGRDSPMTDVIGTVQAAESRGEREVWGSVLGDGGSSRGVTGSQDRVGEVLAHGGVAQILQMAADARGHVHVGVVARTGAVRALGAQRGVAEAAVGSADGRVVL